MTGPQISMPPGPCQAARCRASGSSAPVSLAALSVGTARRRSAGFTLPLVSFSIATAVSSEGIDLPRLMRDACDRLQFKARANQRSSRSSPIHVSSFVMLRMCTTCT